MKRTPSTQVLPTPEPELFALVQVGDHEAFRVLFRRHQQPVYLTAYRVLQSRDDAEEIMQDSFLTMWKKRARIDLVGESTLPWLVTTARFLALNRRRATAHARNDPLDAAGNLADAARSPEAEVLAQELAEHLDSIISAMPGVDQEILRLCLIDELSYEQAARQLGITHGSVRNRLSRLKLRLRQDLEVLKGVGQP